MAEIELRAGARFDLASSEELRETTWEQTRELAPRLDRIARELAPLTFTETAVLEVVGGTIGGGAGGTGEPVYRVPEGHTARVVRVALGVDPNVATPAAPVVAGWVALYVNAPSPQTLAFLFPPTGTTTVAPVVYSEDQPQAQALKVGDQLVALGADLAVAQLGLRLQTILRPVAP